MSALNPEALLVKREALKDRLINARTQVEIMEQQASLHHNLDACEFHRARANFNALIPNGNKMFGCSSSCRMFCKCSYHLFEPELTERHQLYMRYFTAKETAETYIQEAEQASFAMPAAKRQAEAPKQRKPKKSRHKALKEEQLSLAI